MVQGCSNMCSILAGFCKSISIGSWQPKYFPWKIFLLTDLTVLVTIIMQQSSTSFWKEAQDLLDQSSCIGFKEWCFWPNRLEPIQSQNVLLSATPMEKHIDTVETCSWWFQSFLHYWFKHTLSIDSACHQSVQVSSDFGNIVWFMWQNKLSDSSPNITYKKLRTMMR